MSGSYHFYLFISNHGGFQAFKNTADKNNNKTIEFNELYTYVHNNDELKDKVSKLDMYEIWSHLDTYSIGDNNDSTNGVSEVGSLNNDEQQTMETTVIVYGKLAEKIPNFISDIINSTTYELDQESIIAGTIDSIIDAYHNNVDKILELINNGGINNDIKQYSTVFALEQVKEQALANLGNQYLPEGLDYDTTKDPDLLIMIKKYIDDFDIAYGQSFDVLVHDIEEIIRYYIETAGIEADDGVCPTGYEWDPYTYKMNALQIAVLTKKYNDALAAADFSEYGGLNALQESISAYVTNMISSWKELYSAEFDIYNEMSDYAIVEDFLNTLPFDKDLAKRSDTLTAHLNKYTVIFENNPNREQIVEALKDFAYDYIDNYTGTNMYIFWQDLDKELDIWVNTPLPELLDNACKEITDDSEFEDMAEALRKIFRRAHACGVKFSMGGQEVDAEGVLNSYSSSNKADLAALISNIRVKIADALADLTMTNANEKYPDGYVLNINGTAVFTKSDISNWYDANFKNNAPDGSYKYSSRDSARYDLKCYVWPTIKDNAKELCRKFGLIYREEQVYQIYEKYANIATNQDNMPYLGDWAATFEGGGYKLNLANAASSIISGFKTDYLNDYVYKELGMS